MCRAESAEGSVHQSSAREGVFSVLGSVDRLIFL